MNSILRRLCSWERVDDVAALVCFSSAMAVPDQRTFRKIGTGENDEGLALGASGKRHAVTKASDELSAVLWKSSGNATRAALAQELLRDDPSSG
jgi:hypothetical protein